MPNPLTLLLRLGMTTVHRCRIAVWFLTRPRTYGVRAIVLTPEGQVVLVRHRYVRGWHLPSGGRRPDEPAGATIVRELREEIGLEAGGAPEWIDAFEQISSYRRDHVDVFLVRDARYQPPRSLEIEAVAAFDPRALPRDVADGSRRQIARYVAL